MAASLQQAWGRGAGPGSSGIGDPACRPGIRDLRRIHALGGPGSGRHRPGGDRLGQVVGMAHGLGRGHSRGDDCAGEEVRPRDRPDGSLPRTWGRVAGDAQPHEPRRGNGGHPGAGGGETNLLHMVAASVWVGGLAGLLLLAASTVTTLAGPQRRMVLAAVVPRFSVLAGAQRRYARGHGGIQRVGPGDDRGGPCVTLRHRAPGQDRPRARTAPPRRGQPAVGEAYGWPGTTRPPGGCGGWWPPRSYWPSSSCWS